MLDEDDKTAQQPIAVADTPASESQVIEKSTDGATHS